MQSPKKSSLIIIALSIALGGSLVALGWALFQNYWWRRSVDLIADEAGASWAMSSFRRGQLAIWEINPTNDFPRFSGRRDGPFEIWLDEYHAYMPAPWQYTQRRKLEAYNAQMRYMYGHPERFTPGKDERKVAQPDGAANRR
jgi:hypothetical protein